MIGAKKITCMGMKKSGAVKKPLNRTVKGSGNAVQRSSITKPSKTQDSLPRTPSSGKTFKTVRG